MYNYNVLLKWNIELLCLDIENDIKELIFLRYIYYNYKKYDV